VSRAVYSSPSASASASASTSTSSTQYSALSTLLSLALSKHWLLLIQGESNTSRTRGGYSIRSCCTDVWRSAARVLIGKLISNSLTVEPIRLHFQCECGCPTSINLKLKHIPLCGWLQIVFSNITKPIWAYWRRLWTCFCHNHPKPAALQQIRVPIMLALAHLHSLSISRSLFNCRP
jgi:hypothetical protein